jgi:O-antigen ligase
LPILPGRATNLIDLGLLGGIAVAAGHWLLTPTRTARTARTGFPAWSWTALLAGWALVATTAAVHGEVALREWRTVFLAALLFALLLDSCRDDRTAGWLLLGSWLGGALLMAGIGAGQFVANANLIETEGVRRVAALYGSPNNLALYLERALMPSLALLLFLPNGLARAAAGLAAALLGAVLLLTFSKGALILGLPAGLLTLWLGGLFFLRRRGASTQPLWWLAAAALAAGLLLLPFLGTERFQRLFDLNSGTGFTRLQLWRSAWQMALDHPLLGVGPDNFLYAYRSIYLLPAAWQEPNLNHPHTWLLDWWTRLGLPGMALGLGWWGFGLAALVRRLRTVPPTDPAQAALWLGLLAAGVAALAHGLIDLSYAVPDLMLVWVLITLLPTFTADPIQTKPAEAIAPAG